MNLITNTNLTRKGTSVKKIKSALKSISKKANKSLGNHESLFHFTSAESLGAILNSRELWLSHYQGLNDPTEVRFLYNEIVQSINNEYNGLEGFFDDFEEKYWSQLRIFSISLCENLNNSHLWENYSNNHTGVALGYSISDLHDSMDEINWSFIRSKVKYGSSEICNCFGPALNRVCKHMMRKDANNSEIIPRFLSVLLSEMPCFKESNWAEEQEHRYHAMDYDFDRRIPEEYIENGHITLRSISPSKIILGRDSILNINDVGNLLVDNKLRGIDITRMMKRESST